MKDLKLTHIIVCILLALLVHVIFEAIVRPEALNAISNANANGESLPRTFSIIIKDLEQEICIILFLIGIYLITSKIFQLNSKKYLFDVDFLEDIGSNKVSGEKAISELETHNLIHNDIKSDNIVLHNNSFKLIDFELTDKVSKPKVFQERSLQEFYNNRLYFVYPLDYLFYSVIDEEIQKEIVSIYKRKHCDDYISIHNSFQRDTLTSINNVIETLLQESIPYRKIIKKIDVYSLGIIIPYLFLKFSSIKNPHKQDVMISDFYNLFALMTDPLSKSRISSKKSYQLFTSLLKKYKMYSPTNITKKSRRRSTRRRSTRRRSIIS